MRALLGQTREGAAKDGILGDRVISISVMMKLLHWNSGVTTQRLRLGNLTAGFYLKWNQSVSSRQKLAIPPIVLVGNKVCNYHVGN